MSGTKIIFNVKNQQNTIKVPNIENIKFNDIKNCVICKSRNIQLLSELKGSLQTSQCLECSHMFHSKKPKESWYRKWYSKNWDTKKKMIRSKKTLKQTLIENLLVGKPAIQGDNIGNFSSNYIKKGMKVLDIGCGNGDRLHHFKKFGADVYGIEASNHRANIARNKGINVKNIQVNELDKQTFNTKFDFIYASHVLEHVYYIEEFFQSMKKVLKTEGFFSIAVPNQNHDYLLANFLYALHIHFFSPKSLIKICIMNDLIPFKVFNEHQTVIFGQYKPKDIPKNFIKQISETYNTKIYNHQEILENIFETSKLDEINKQIIWSNNKKKDFGFYSTFKNASGQRNVFEILKISKLKKSILFLEENNSNSTKFWVR